MSIGSEAHPCVKCQCCYATYKLLLEHLYWRHGTESQCCNTCDVKRWIFADHYCNVLPIDDDMESEFTDEVDDDMEIEHNIEEETQEPAIQRESEYCFCGKNTNSDMIGCDGPDCAYQWFHYECVGIKEPPVDDWFCSTCSGPSKQKRQKQNNNRGIS